MVLTVQASKCNCTISRIPVTTEIIMPNILSLPQYTTKITHYCNINVGTVTNFICTDCSEKKGTILLGEYRYKNLKNCHIKLGSEIIFCRVTAC